MSGGLCGCTGVRVWGRSDSSTSVVPAFKEGAVAKVDFYRKSPRDSSLKGSVSTSVWVTESLPSRPSPSLPLPPPWKTFLEEATE